MPSTYTLNNGIELIGTGEQSGTWGDTTNTNLDLLDAALDGQVTITLGAAGSSGSPNALPITDGTASNGRNRMVVFADGGDLGATAYVQLTPNDAEKIIYIRNSLSGSRSVILFQGTYNASNDYEVPAGTTAVVYFDGAGAGAVAANVFNNAYFDGLRLGSVSVTAILDEDNMASDSATALATQQSIKAYVDSQVGTVDTLAEILAIGNTTGATDIAVDSAQKVQFRDAAIYINSSVDGQLDIVADTEIQIAATTVDLNGALDVSGTALVTGVLTTTAATVFNGGFTANADSTLGTDKKVQFRDAAIYINSSVDGQLDIVADTEIQIAATTVDVNGALDVSGTALVTGVLTTTAATVSNGGGQFNGAINVGVDDTGYDVKFFGATTGKSLLWDESADSLIVTGTTTLVGTTNLDAVDIDGATQIDATVTVGVDDTGYDVKFFGATAGKYMLWDESADTLEVSGTVVADGLTVSGAQNSKVAYFDDSSEVGYRQLQFTSSNLSTRSIDRMEINTGGDISFYAADGTTPSFVYDESAGLTINEAGADRDFRVESDTNTHMLFVDGGSNHVNIGTATDLAGVLNVDGNISLSGAGTGSRSIALLNESDSYAGILRIQAGGISAAYGAGIALYGHSHASNPGDVVAGISSGSGGSFRVNTDGVDTGTDRLEVKDTGALTTTPSAGGHAVFNEAGIDADFRVESDTNANALFVQGSDGNVGIGIGSPSLPLHVHSTTSGLPVTSGTTQTNGAFRLTSSATSGTIDFGMNGSNPWIQATDYTGLNNNYNLLLNPNGGNVGIGTTSPTQQLDVTATGATTAIIVAQNTTATSGGASLRAGNPQNTLIMGTDSDGGGLTGTANASYFYTTSASPILFMPNTVERMRIHGSGGLSFANTTDVGPYNAVLGYRNNHFTGQRSNTVAAGDTSTVFTLVFGLNGAAIVRVVDTGTVVTSDYFMNVYEYFVTCYNATVTATLKQSQAGGGAGSKITTSTSASTFNVIQTGDAGLTTWHDTAIDVLVVAAGNGSHATATITMAANN
jgi:DUF2075 family protein